MSETPDVLNILFNHYIVAELRSAGARVEAISRLLDWKDSDIAARFNCVHREWSAVKWTGYGEAVRMGAGKFFGLEEISAAGLAKAQEKLPNSWTAGQRGRILREDGGFAFVQVDSVSWRCERDLYEPEFFQQDISWYDLSCGLLDRDGLEEETGVQVKDLKSLDAAMATVMQKFGSHAVAMKTQFCYRRTLQWNKRDWATAERVLKKELAAPGSLNEEEHCCLGDWCLGRGIELAIERQLPVKIHTGYLASVGIMDLKFVNPSLLCPLIREYGRARFILMHMGYPFVGEIMVMAKHYPNIWVDLCWAWALNPAMAKRFLHEYIRGAPINKIFGFGGDCRRPHHSVCFGLQARKHLADFLDNEVRSGEFRENEAIMLAQRLMRGNQVEFFGLAENYGLGVNSSNSLKR